MERSRFKNEFVKASTQLDKRKCRSIIRRSVDSICDQNPRGHHELIITMEELNELGQQVSKRARGIGDDISLIEEMADVAICLMALQEICGISTQDLYRAMNVKFDRLGHTLDEKGVYL